MESKSQSHVKQEMDIPWTDLIRDCFGSVPENNRKMSTWVRKFCFKKQFEVVYVLSGRYAKTQRWSPCIPGRFQATFLEEFIEAFPEIIHGIPDVRQPKKPRPNDDGEAVGIVIREVSKTSDISMLDKTELKQKAVTDGDVDNTSIPCLPRDTLAPPNAMTVWSDAINRRFPDFLTTHAKNSKLLGRLRKCIRWFLETRAPSVGLSLDQCIGIVANGKRRKSYAIPRALMNEFDAWVAVQIEGRFNNPEEGMAMDRSQIISKKGVRMDAVYVVDRDIAMTLEATGSDKVDHTIVAQAAEVAVGDDDSGGGAF
ncbi:hypothetical protein HDU67_003407 [Dinochytrium kinnereticum]|nr:hypothetical protein HDU67_003407 [Dinochytrium kinnereticum]